LRLGLYHKESAVLLGLHAFACGVFPLLGSMLESQNHFIAHCHSGPPLLRGLHWISLEWILR